MLCLWSKASKYNVLNALSPVLKPHQDLEVQVVNDMQYIPNPPGMTALLALGKEPLALLAEHKLVAKNRTITSLRMQLIALPEATAKAMVSYGVGISEVDYGHFVDLQCDVSAAIRVAKTGSLKPVYGEYKYVPDLTYAIHNIEALHAANKAPVRTALDLETRGLDPYCLQSGLTPSGYIISIQVTHTPGQADVIYFKSEKDFAAWWAVPLHQQQLGWLLNNPAVMLVGANLKYDLHWIYRKTGLECTNFRFDTTLVGSLLDENRGNGLDIHAKIYVPAMAGYSDEFDRTVEKSRMDLVPPEKLLPYAGGDTDAALQVSIAQREALLQDGPLTQFYVNIMHPAARAFEHVERQGALVDMNAYKELEADLNTEIHSLILKARSLLGGRIWAKHHDQDKLGGINLSKASMLTDFMFSPMGLNLTPKMYTAGSYDGKKLKPDPKPSTALEHLMMFKEAPEAHAFVSLLSDFGSATKTLQTYVTGFQKHLRSDGRYHPSYFFFAGNKDSEDGGTVTGRLSCKSPAFQCCIGSTVVLTDSGGRRIDNIVEQGGGCLVLTHTGEWKPVVGVYRNGVQPVFRVTTVSGKSVTCTANHPLLTQCGFVRTDEILTAYHHLIGYTERPQSGCFNGTVQGCEGVRGVPGFGVEEQAGQTVCGAGTGHAPATDCRGAITRSDGILWRVENHCLSYQEGRALGFEADAILSIEEVPAEETFDLTIEDSHSFVANGLVVHNTIPKHTKWAKQLRRCYIAPPGYLVVERDYSQGELRVVACIANELTMIQAYLDGKDLHCVTGAKLAGMEYDALIALKKTDPDLYDSFRQPAKPANFGLLYGQFPPGFRVYAENNYGVVMSLERATEIREDFFLLYPGLPVYHDQYKKFASKYGHVRSPLGRIRHLPLINSRDNMVKMGAERQAINSPVQGCLSDMLLWAIAIEQQQGLTAHMPCFGAIHDAAYNYVHEDRVDQDIKAGIDIMQNLPFNKVGWNPQLQFFADAKFGKNMGDLHAWKP